MGLLLQRARLRLGGVQRDTPPPPPPPPPVKPPGYSGVLEPGHLYGIQEVFHFMAGKHISMTYCPQDGLVWSNFGDRLTSYATCIYKTDYAKVLQRQTQITGFAGNGGPILDPDSIILEAPMDSTNVWPRRWDWASMTWDSTRNIFWCVPGFDMGDADSWTGTTYNDDGDHRLPCHDVFTYDPNNPTPAARYKRQYLGSINHLRNPPYDPSYMAWYAIYDEVYDHIVLLTPGHIQILNCALGYNAHNYANFTTWAWPGTLSPAWSFRTWAGNWPTAQACMGIDLVGRYVYYIDISDYVPNTYQGRVRRISLDDFAPGGPATITSTDCGAMPGDPTEAQMRDSGALDTDGISWLVVPDSTMGPETWMTYDPVAKALVWVRPNGFLANGAFAPMDIWVGRISGTTITWTKVDKALLTSPSFPQITNPNGALDGNGTDQFYWNNNPMPENYDRVVVRHMVYDPRNNVHIMNAGDQDPYTWFLRVANNQSVPAWLADSGNVVNHVVEIPHTSLLPANKGGSAGSVGLDLTPITAAGLYPGGVSGYWNSPYYNRWGYSTGCLRETAAGIVELIVAGGGGAGAWGGNEMVGLRFSEDQPSWHYAVLPSASTDYNQTLLDTSPVGVMYLTDGVPNSAHYTNGWRGGAAYDNVNDRFLSMWRQAFFHNDKSSDTSAIACPYGQHWPVPAVYVAPSKGPGTESQDNGFCIPDPATGNIWQGAGDYINLYNVTTNTYTSWNLTGTQIGAAMGALNPVENCLMLFYTGSYTATYTLDLSSKGTTLAALSGPYVTALSNPTVLIDGAGDPHDSIPTFTWDAGLGKMLVYQPNDGVIYTVQYLAPNSWYVDKLALDAVIPPGYAMGGTGASPYIYGKFQYSAKLGGVVLIRDDAYKNAIFIRTT